jgi:predicted dehydrogenase
VTSASAARDGSLGVAVIGAGTIGTLRAELAGSHPRVGYLSVCDTDTGKRDRLADRCAADAIATDAEEAANDPRVHAVIVATTEDQHYAPALAAIEAGKPVLVEKPFTVDLEEGRRLTDRAREAGVPMCVGFTQRFRRRYLSAKEHIVQGYLGSLSTVGAKIYVTRAVAEAVMNRASTTSPSINTLTYCADLVLWYLEGRRPVTVYAQGGHGALHERYGVPDSTWALVTFDDGTVVNLGVSWEPPHRHPAYVAQMQVELFGNDGMLSINDDHRDALLVSEAPIPSPYTPDVTMHAALLGSAMPGDWALGRFYGPMRDETDLFLEGAASGAMPEVLPDGEHGLAVLALTRAIDESVASGQVVRLS